MPNGASTFEPDRRGDAEFTLHFTPAEWRTLIEDPAFMKDPDNGYVPPRRLSGMRVAIVPDHQFG